jgi:hypothetical protein
MKFPIDVGSEESRDLLFNIKQSGDENNNFYLNKLIQKLLDYKFKQFFWTKNILSGLHVSFLACVMIFPFREDLENNHTHTMIGIYLGLFVLRESIQITEFCSRRRKSHQSIGSYFSVWNFLDWINIITMGLYFFLEGSASIYSILTLVTWINLL